MKGVLQRRKDELKVLGYRALVLVLVAGLMLFFTPFDRCIVGLSLNAVGVLITFIFAFPQKDYDVGYVLVPERGTIIDEKTGKTEADVEDENEASKKWQKKWSFLGLAYLLIGITFQIVHQALGK